MRKRVLDLNAGLGGRIYAFEKAGFEIIAAIDMDHENCEIIASWMNKDKVLNYNLLEADPDALPDADIITAKYIQRLNYKTGNIEYDILQNTNTAIFNIISKKSPFLFLLEVPVNSIISKRQELEDYIQMFYEIGYSVSYAIYDEKSFSGYPVVGRQGYIIGCRIGESVEFKFPQSSNINFNRKLIYDLPENIDPWYRKLNFLTNDWERGYFYLGIRGVVEKTEYIHMGYMRENYCIDQIGPRRLTHNELASLKGLYQYNYNNQRNKRRMYNKIAYASNVYVVEAIANVIRDYIYHDSEMIVSKDGEESLKKISRKKGDIEKKLLFPKRLLKEIKIEKLKGINNLSLRFEKNITALMGVNGSGKSTILHALACTYTPYQKGEDYKFSYFFTPNPDASWNGSCFTVTNYDINEKKDISKKYEKKKDRWARYASRPERDLYFMGIASCIPEIELEKKTSFINYVSKTLNDKITEKIVLAASYILNKDYEDLLMHVLGRKKYMGVHTRDEVKWLVPEQRSIQFEKICSEIIMAGGQVNTISAGIHSYYDGKIIISCSGNSRHDSSRMPKYKHETGIAIKICGRKLNGEELTILVEGDQDYDYVDDSFLKDIDILVACHHGGKYSWTIYSELPQPRTDESCVIYSYGINNSYGHPSKKNEHNSNGWTNEWDTINGDYSIDVIL